VSSAARGPVPLVIVLLLFALSYVNVTQLAQIEQTSEVGYTAWNPRERLALPHVVTEQLRTQRGSFESFLALGRVAPGATIELPADADLEIGRLRGLARPAAVEQVDRSGRVASAVTETLLDDAIVIGPYGRNARFLIVGQAPISHLTVLRAGDDVIFIETTAAVRSGLLP
jgi:hypothetical protein